MTPVFTYYFIFKIY